MQTLDRATRMLRSAILWATVIIFACAAAVVSHIAIDGIANFVVAHDPFDDVAHGSRSVLALCVAGLFATVAFCTVISGLSDARSRFSAFGRALTAAGAASACSFALRIAPLCIVLLLSMEAGDALVAGVRIDGAEDLLGGSVPLGLGITICVAIAAAIGARRLLIALGLAHRVLAAAVARLVRLPIRRTSISHFGRLRDGSRAGSSSVLARRAGKRAPPLIAA
jgi:hypothetical protein